MVKTIVYMNDSDQEKSLHSGTDCIVLNSDKEKIITIKPQEVALVYYKEESVFIKDWGKVILFKERYNE